MHSYCCHSNNQKSVHYEILKKVSTRERLQILLSIMTQQYLFCLSLYPPHCLFSIHLSLSLHPPLCLSRLPPVCLSIPLSLCLFTICLYLYPPLPISVSPLFLIVLHSFCCYSCWWLLHLHPSTTPIDAHMHVVRRHVRTHACTHALTLACQLSLHCVPFSIPNSPFPLIPDSGVGIGSGLCDQCQVYQEYLPAQLQPLHLVDMIQTLLEEELFLST